MTTCAVFQPHLSGLSQTDEARFLRGLNISPKAAQERLEHAASEYNSHFGGWINWQQMPELLASAWGEVSTAVSKRKGVILKSRG